MYVGQEWQIVGKKRRRLTIRLVTVHNLDKKLQGNAVK